MGRLGFISEKRGGALIGNSPCCFSERKACLSDSKRQGEKGRVREGAGGKLRGVRAGGWHFDVFAPQGGGSPNESWALNNKIIRTADSQTAGSSP